MLLYTEYDGNDYGYAPYDSIGIYGVSNESLIPFVYGLLVVLMVGFVVSCLCFVAGLFVGKSSGFKKLFENKYERIEQHIDRV